MVHIGSLHPTAEPERFSRLKPATIAVEGRSEAVRQTLAEARPGLAGAMVVRLAEGPRTE